jgi:hypothetical protein
MLIVFAHAYSKTVCYAAGHTGVIYDYAADRQQLLQGHVGNKVLLLDTTLF